MSIIKTVPFSYENLSNPNLELCMNITFSNGKTATFAVPLHQLRVVALSMESKESDGVGDLATLAAQIATSYLPPAFYLPFMGEEFGEVLHLFWDKNGKPLNKTVNGKQIGSLYFNKVSTFKVNQAEIWDTRAIIAEEGEFYCHPSNEAPYYKMIQYTSKNEHVIKTLLGMGMLFHNRDAGRRSAAQLSKAISNN